jgi:proton-translocating NADH-quinone oxidoreductase chain M
MLYNNKNLKKNSSLIPLNSVLIFVFFLFFFSWFLNAANIILFLLITPLIGIFILLIIPENDQLLLKKSALFISFLNFIFSIYLLLLFNNQISEFQFVNQILWVPNLNLNCTVGVDGISLFFVLLTTFLIPLCLLASWDSIKFKIKQYLILFLLLEFFLIGVFCILDVFLFYIFFESVLIPMFFIIGIWGSRERKIKAAYFFFFYTLLGSVIMLIALIYIYSSIGTTDYELLLTIKLSCKEQKFLWFAFFISFAAKVPMLPVHVWLPEAHVEAPTTGSVILAGILLKLGTYGFIRFLIPLFPLANEFFYPFIYSLASIGVVYTSFTAIRQTDFKRIIAYTSVAHMNFVVIGLFSKDSIGIEGALFQSLSHGIVSSALFLIIGIVYDRHHTRLVKYYGGLVHTMPVFVFVFLLFTLANMALPGTSSFIGELLILISAYSNSTTTVLIIGTSMFVGSCYSLWLFNKIAYGNLKNLYILQFYDLTKREFFVFLPLIILTIIMGIFPSIVLDPMHFSVNNLLMILYNAA